MMKKFYLVCAAALMAFGASATTGASYEYSTVVNGDESIDGVTCWSYMFANNVLIPAGSSLTSTALVFNYIAVPMDMDNHIRLDNGGVFKFYSDPETSAITEADLMMYPTSYAGSLTETPYSFYVTGTDNEIYLGEGQKLGGSIIGDGDVTVYVGKGTTFNFATTKWVSGVMQNLPGYENDTLIFSGHLYVKSLTGEPIDTINFGTAFPGATAGNVSYAKNEFNQPQFVLDINGVEGVVLYASASAAWPRIDGKGVVRSATTWIKPTDVFGQTVYDVDFEGGRDANTAVEYYGAGGSDAPQDIVFNGNINSVGNFFYVRNDADIKLNGSAMLSNVVSGLSSREGGLISGDGYVNSSIAPRSPSHRAMWVSAGQGRNNIGTLTMDYYYNPSDAAGGLEFDFDGKDADRLIFLEEGQLSSGSQAVKFNLMDSFFDGFPTTGNYLVLRGNVVEGATAINDTIGYYVYDNEMQFAVRSEDPETPDTIQYASTLAKRFPGIATNGDHSKSGYDGDENGIGGNNRYCHALLYWGEGTGEGADYQRNPNRPTNHADFTEDAPLTVAINAVNAKVGEGAGYIPNTNDSAWFVGHELIAGFGAENNAVKPILYQYDKVVNYDFVFSTNAVEKVWSEGDTLRLSANTLRNTFKTENGTYVNDTIPGSDGQDSIVSVFKGDGTYTLNFETKPFAIKVGEKEVNYWFNFQYFFTDGIIQLLSDENSEVSKDEAPVAHPSDTGIETTLKETKAVAARTIFTIDGKRVNSYQPGLNIVTVRYTDGSVETKKIFMAE